MAINEITITEPIRTPEEKASKGEEKDKDKLSGDIVNVIRDSVLLGAIPILEEILPVIVVDAVVK